MLPVPSYEFDYYEDLPRSSTLYDDLTEDNLRNLDGDQDAACKEEVNSLPRMACSVRFSLSKMFAVKSTGLLTITYCINENELWSLTIRTRSAAAISGLTPELQTAHLWQKFPIGLLNRRMRYMGVKLICEIKKKTIVPRTRYLSSIREIQWM